MRHHRNGVEGTYVAPFLPTSQPQHGQGPARCVRSAPQPRNGVCGDQAKRAATVSRRMLHSDRRPGARRAPRGGSPLALHLPAPLGVEPWRQCPVRRSLGSAQKPRSWRAPQRAGGPVARHRCQAGANTLTRAGVGSALETRTTPPWTGTRMARSLPIAPAGALSSGAVPYIP
jgi:hypothetical protein